MNKPQRLFYFLHELTELTKKYGLVIPEGNLDFIEDTTGLYCLNPNNEGPEFGWLASGPTSTMEK